MPPASSDKSLLLVGASRGLGFALAEEYLKCGWHVVATERDGTTSKLPRLLGVSGGRLVIETVDIDHPDQVAALRRGWHRESSPCYSSMPASRMTIVQRSPMFRRTNSYV